MIVTPQSTPPQDDDAQQQQHDESSTATATTTAIGSTNKSNYHQNKATSHRRRRRSLAETRKRVTNRKRRRRTTATTTATTTASSKRRIRIETKATTALYNDEQPQQEQQQQQQQHDDTENTGIRTALNFDSRISIGLINFEDAFLVTQTSQPSPPPDRIEGHDYIASLPIHMNSKFRYHPHKQNVIPYSNNRSRSRSSKKESGELVLFNDTAFLSSRSNARVWFRDDLPPHSLSSTYSSESSDHNNRNRYCSVQDRNVEKLWQICSELCREAHLLLLFRERLLQNNTNNNNNNKYNGTCTIVPIKFVLARNVKRVMLQLDCTTRLATAGQYLTYSISMSTMIGQQQQLNEKAMANLIYEIIQVVSDCHACDIVHGDLNLNSFLMREGVGVRCAVSLVGFGPSGIDARQLLDDNVEPNYSVDCCALANIIHLLLTGNDIPTYYTTMDDSNSTSTTATTAATRGQQLRLSQYLIGRVTYEALICELLQAKCPLHMNAEMAYCMNILEALTDDGDDYDNGPSPSCSPILVPELVERSFLTTTTSASRSNHHHCKAHYKARKCNNIRSEQLDHCTTTTTIKQEEGKNEVEIAREQVEKLSRELEATKRRLESLEKKQESNGCKQSRKPGGSRSAVVLLDDSSDEEDDNYV